MYEGLGYSIYRRVREYYGSLGLGRNAKDEEDACFKLGVCTLTGAPEHVRKKVSTLLLRCVVVVSV